MNRLKWETWKFDGTWPAAIEDHRKAFLDAVEKGLQPIRMGSTVVNIEPVKLTDYR